MPDALGVGNHKIHIHPHSSELPQARASLSNAATTATPQRTMPTTTSDAEIAMACAEIEITKETESKGKIKHNVRWKAKCARYAYKPAGTQNKCEAYEQYINEMQLSISKELPEQKQWIPADQWKPYEKKAHARNQLDDKDRGRWQDDDSASRYHQFHLAQAKQSALIMSLDIDVGAGARPEKWPAVISGPVMYTYGPCDLPPFEDYTTYRGRICYVNEMPVGNLIEQVAEISVENKVDVVIAAQVAETPMIAVASTLAPIAPNPHESVPCPVEAAGPVELLRPAQVADITDVTSTATRPGHTLRSLGGNAGVGECITDEEDNVETHDDEIPATSMTEDIVVFPPYPSESAGNLVKKAWTGHIYASAVPDRLRNQPRSRLIYRRIVPDTNDNNKIIGNSYTYATHR
jgi:hypothetical protein